MLHKICNALERPAIAETPPPVGDFTQHFPDGTIIEASPLADFDTAAGHFHHGGVVEVPTDVRRAYRGEFLYLRAVDRRSGRIIASAAQKLE